MPFLLAAYRGETYAGELFTNLGDPSALFQVVFQNDLRENLVLVSSIKLPLGADGTEFGGLPADVAGLYLAGGPGLFVQLGWYF